MNENKKTVVLGLSGGVDSAVSAYILKKQGYNVIGVFMRNWDSEVNNDIKGNKTLDDEKCSQEFDYDDAKKVAKQLDIKIERIDFIKEYYNKVFQKSLDMWNKGITPNPDVLCNKYIKYGDFIEEVNKKFKPDYISMGHYAAIKEIKGQKYLAISKDKHKDQTYFLAEINKDIIKKLIFPLSNLKKDEVRKIARDQNLFVADKKDSTGICFIGERDFQKFLENYIDVKVGDIVDIESKKIVGTHKGIVFYTIGQRRGLNLGGQEGRYFVVKKDLKNNILYVYQGTDNKYLYKKKIELTNFNYLVDSDFLKKHKFLLKKTYLVKYRHSEYISKAKVKFGDKVSIKFVKKQRSISEGQEAVIYTNDKNNIVIGGGYISKIF